MTRERPRETTMTTSSGGRTPGAFPVAPAIAFTARLPPASCRVLHPGDAA